MGKDCDQCNHMIEKTTVESIHFNQQLKIHGHLVHDKAPAGKLRWFIYSICDLPCNKIIVGSTQDPKFKWAKYKSTCNLRKSNATGLYTHFKDGCPNDKGTDKSTLDFTLIDFFDTTKEKLRKVKHESGGKCKCSECWLLRDLEIIWILKVGSFYGSSGLNSRNDIKKKTRSK